MTTKDHKLEPLMTRPQAADYLQVSVGTLAHWDCSKRYDLKPIKIGKRSVRYRRADLDAFMERWKPQRPY